MAVPLLTLNSLLPSQSLFNEIQSIHETGFFHELDSFFSCRDGVPVTPSSTQVNTLDTMHAKQRWERGAYTLPNSKTILHNIVINFVKENEVTRSMDEIENRTRVLLP